MKVFVDFAFLPALYLNKFERFTRLYEAGSITGQPISARQLAKKNKKSKVTSKLEIPINFLKMHLTVSQELRDNIMDDILEGTITFLEYSERLETASKLANVKVQVEKISKESFADLRLKHSVELSDDVLKEYCGAKVSSEGGNTAYKKLVQHIDKVLSGANSSIATDNGTSTFVACDQMNVIDRGNEMKKYKVVVINSKEGDETSFKNEYALLEVVKRTEGIIGVLINSDEQVLKQTISRSFCAEKDLYVDFVLFKRNRSVVINGFKKNFLPVAVFGRASAFQFMEIKTMYNSSVAQSLELMLINLTSSSDQVLYAFNDADMYINVDGCGGLSKKNVRVHYMASHVVLAKIK